MNFRQRWPFLVLSLVLPAACAQYGSDRPNNGTDPEGKYALHEWGVNTPRLEGGAAVQAGPAQYSDSMARKPVIYVYADEPIFLDVGVSFASGGSSETWPELPGGPELAWDDLRVTRGPCETTPVPVPDGESELGQLSRWVVPSADCLTYGETVSKLLFYSGELADYQPPLAARVDFEIDYDAGADRLVVELSNDGPEAVGPTLLIYRDAEEDCIDTPSCTVSRADVAWGGLEGLEPGESAAVDLRLVHLQAGPAGGVTPPAGWDAMLDSLRDMLANAGLYEEEIEVFVDTWRDSFFGLYGENPPPYSDYANGGFAIHLWPAAHTAEQLPLTLDPLPRELSRVIVQYQQVSPPVRMGEIFGTVWLEGSDSMNPEFTTPAAGATVTAWQDGTSVADAVSDEDGKYTLVLPAGTYDVSVARHEDEIGDNRTGVEVLAWESLELDLYLGAGTVVFKPNLYLYPTRTTRVDVLLGLCPGCRVVASEPEYGDGWHVTVEPGGLIDGRHTYLFYEAVVPPGTPSEPGWSVSRLDLADFFTRTLDAYGFTPAERNDFVEYWSNALQPAPYYQVFPMLDSEVDAKVGLDIHPTPDSIFRLWFAIRPADAPVSLPEPEVTPMVRQGFTAVEWGVILP